MRRSRSCWRSLFAGNRLSGAAGGGGRDHDRRRDARLGRRPRDRAREAAAPLGARVRARAVRDGAAGGVRVRRLVLPRSGSAGWARSSWPAASRRCSCSVTCWRPARRRQRSRGEPHASGRASCGGPHRARAGVADAVCWCCWRCSIPAATCASTSASASLDGDRRRGLGAVRRRADRHGRLAVRERTDGAQWLGVACVIAGVSCCSRYSLDELSRRYPGQVCSRNDGR